MLNDLLCDLDGVPLMIQKLTYFRSDMTWEGTFFNGVKKKIPEEFVGNCMELMQYEPTNMQYLQALNAFEKVATDNWRDWMAYNCLITSARTDAQKNDDA